MKNEVVTKGLELVGPMTTKELQRYFDVAQTTVQKPLKRLLLSREIRIYGYEAPPDEVGGRHAPIYALNPNDEPDAKEPRRKPAKVRDKAYRERNKVAISARRYGNRGIAGGGDLGIWGGLVR